ncbi:MAG: UDP-N-acetylmuramate dehydrogenase [Opitutales bacterium]
MRVHRDQAILFLGVGGMGMAPLACWLCEDGYRISGYDNSLQECVRTHLEHAGVALHDFLPAQRIGCFDVVVHSSALRADHPLLIAAKEAGLPCLRRGELLAELANGKRLIAVAGSHGKTTTCGMIAYAVRKLGLRVNYILGGLFADEDLPPSHHTGSDWLVAEVDESDGTIERFHPEHTLLLNIDWDHADYYAEAAQLEATFFELARRTRGRVWHPEGLVLPPALTNGVAFPVHPVAQGRAAAGLNAGNRSAAITVLRELADELPEDVLAGFPGMARRQSVRYESGPLTVIEDYAHHPTEITALLRDLRGRAGGRSLHVVFQPHRYSRTRQFCRRFAESLAPADQLSLLPVYGAHERVVEGGELDDLRAACGGLQAECLNMGLNGVDRVCAAARGAPTLLAFVGAGDIQEFAAACVCRLRQPQSVDAAFLDYVRGRSSPDCLLKLSEPLARRTTMRIGGPARIYAEPANRSDLQTLLRAAALFELPHFCLGRGSNLLVPDAGYDGLVIRLCGPLWTRIESLDADHIWVAAGCRLKEICGFAAKQGLGGFEFLEGIPGSLGGALRMNAGAMGNWIFDVVARVQFIDADGQFQDWPREAFHFGYRKVEEISRGVALGAVLKRGAPGETADIRGRIDTYASTRKGSQPREPSAGCIFKNPEGSYAGKLIDEHGLKGLRVGAAEVSGVHGNFIINTGGATSADVIELVRRVRRRVKEASGYELDPEVLLVGGSWEDLFKEGADG